MAGRLFFYLIVIALVLSGCSGKSAWEHDYPQTIRILTDNSGGPRRDDEIISVALDTVRIKYPDFNPQAFVVTDGTDLLTSQLADSNGDGQMDQIIFICNLSGAAVKSFSLRYNPQGSHPVNYPKRTQAELAHKFGGKFVNHVYEGGEFKNVTYLRVPVEHTDHSFFIRYEGPGWESDKVGYRFYLDWRNAVDIFGKKVHDMVLQQVGLDGFESYHQMSDWGMDILKVGESLGIGSVGMWLDGKAERVSVTDSLTCAIVMNGPLQSMIRTCYYGWQVGDKKYDLISDLTITAGSRLTQCRLKISDDPPNLCTGIVKNDSAKVIVQAESQGAWGYLASYGRQSLANDKLGMAVVYPRNALLEITADKQSEAVVLQPQNGSLRYYFLAAWEEEPQGITTERQFCDYLDHTVTALGQPVTVTIK